MLQDGRKSLMTHKEGGKHATQLPPPPGRHSIMTNTGLKQINRHQLHAQRSTRLSSSNAKIQLRSTGGAHLPSWQCHKPFSYNRGGFQIMGAESLFFQPQLVRERPTLHTYYYSSQWWYTCSTRNSPRVL